jgi:hypothetical protein
VCAGAFLAPLPFGDNRSMRGRRASCAWALRLGQSRQDPLFSVALCADRAGTPLIRHSPMIGTGGMHTGAPVMSAPQTSPDAESQLLP